MDGCAERGAPDQGGAVPGQPPERDYIDECDAQAEVCPLLVQALDAIVS